MKQLKMLINTKAIHRFSATSLSLISSFSLLVIVAAMPASAVTLVSPGSTVEGKTIGEWTAEWWKWAFAQSKPQDAFTDMTGANAGVNQKSPVFFVAGTTGGTATRSFTVPGDQYLLIPMVNFEATESPKDSCSIPDLPPDEPQPGLKECVNYFVGLVDSGFAEIDGMSVIDNSNFKSYYEDSPFFFTYTAADNNPGGDSIVVMRLNTLPIGHCSRG